MQKEPSANCYACGSVATSQDHVPPKCIFPAQKDSAGIDYRKNLIKVPSCDKHNSAMSKDDEFLMVLLALAFENNSVGFRQLQTKVTRALRRRSSKLLKNVIKNPKQTKTPHVLLANTDTKRLEKIISKVALGLHFDYFKRRHSGDLVICSNIFYNPEDDKNTYRQMCIDKADQEIGSEPELGKKSSRI